MTARGGVERGGRKRDFRPVFGSVFRATGRWPGLGLKKAPDRTGPKKAVWLYRYLPDGGTPPSHGGCLPVAGPRQLIIDPPPMGGGLRVAGPRQLINSKFLQVLQIQKWGVRSAKRARIRAAGGPSQLGASIKKGGRQRPISGPGPGGRTPPPMGGVSP